MTKKEIQDILTAQGIKFEQEMTQKQLEELLKMPRIQEEPKVNIEKSKPEEGIVKISKADWENVQEQLKMLKEVADKGRIYNYESQRPGVKSLKIKLSVFKDQVVIGWRTLKDELIKDSRTGATVGESQQYELKLLDKEGNVNNVVIDGYENFSNARYSQRIDAEVIAKKESWDGNQTFDVKLNDNRTIQLDSRFVN